ncbi:50S ribosomal protein L4 [Candidatus Saccharibacteria bacterium]|jgi:Ribosomal protein L4|nr:50S ribosomal protein L4 [Candidatus Saccharibacteria bacterium]
MSVPTFTKSGAKAATPAKLDKAVFAVMPENHELLKLAYSAYLANGRENLAITKTRGLVRGGGKKPWRQKGTGRARVGSIRSPLWRGGGVVFGPTGEENYSKKVNVKAKRLALRQALSLAASENRIIVIEAFENKEAKTAATVKLLDKIEAKGNVLLVLDTKDEQVERAVRNLQHVKAVTANYLTVFDVMNADTLVVTEKALAIINEWLGGKK